MQAFLSYSESFCLLVTQKESGGSETYNSLTNIGKCPLYVIRLALKGIFESLV